MNKLRSLCENKTHTSKRQRSNFCVDLSPDVGPETGMCITTMNILCISVCHTFILLNEYIFFKLKTGFEKTTSDYHDLDAIRDSGTASFEISPVCLLAGESIS